MVSFNGVRPLIGYNYGAGELGRVRSIYRTTLVLNGLIMMAGLIICLTIPGRPHGLVHVSSGNHRSWRVGLEHHCLGERAVGFVH